MANSWIGSLEPGDLVGVLGGPLASLARVDSVGACVVVSGREYGPDGLQIKGEETPAFRYMLVEATPSFVASVTDAAVRLSVEAALRKVASMSREAKAAADMASEAKAAAERRAKEAVAPRRVPFSALVGDVITRAIELDDAVVIETNRGTYTMCHKQDCCEDVSLDSCGDLTLLAGEEVLGAELVENEEKGGRGLTTWAFYKISTNRESVTMCWKGESNGYYSHEVDVMFTPAIRRLP